MLPLLDSHEEDDIDAWADPNSDQVHKNPLLSKYDDVEDFAHLKKRANRIEISGTQTKTAKSK